MKPGDRVFIIGDHPWTGHAGTCARLEDTPLGRAPVVRLDNGMETFVFDRRNWRPA